MRHDAGNTEDGQQQRDGNRPNNDPHQQNHQRLNEAGGRADGVFEFFVEKNRYFVANLCDLSGFFAGAKHLDDARGDQFFVRGQSDCIRKLVAVTNAGIDAIPHRAEKVIITGHSHHVNRIEQADAGVDHRGQAEGR